MRQLIRRYRWHLGFAFVFLLFAFFRFWNIVYRTPFAWDHEQFSTQVYDLVVNHHPTLLGPRVTDAKGFFLAPYFTYLLVPFFIATRMHPSALTIFLVVLNCTFFIVAAVTITQLFSKKHALFFLLSWAVNPLLIKYDTNPWWPVLIPLGTVITWLVLDRIVKTSKRIWWISLGLVLGFFANMHVQFMFVGFYAILFLLLSLRRKIIATIPSMMISLIVFFMMFTPLVLFDLRHEMLNWKLLSAYFSDHVTDNLPYTKAFYIVFANFVQPLIPGFLPILSSVFLLALTIISLVNAKITKTGNRLFHLATALLVILTVLGFAVYGSRPSEYYFTFLFPFIYITIIDLCINTKEEHVLIALLVVISILNKNQLVSSIQRDEGGLYYRDAAIKRLLPITKGKNINISFDMPLGADSGYHYFITYYGIKTTGNPKDPLIELRIPAQPDDILVNGLGIHVPKELK